MFRSVKSQLQEKFYFTHTPSCSESHVGVRSLQCAHLNKQTNKKRKQKTVFMHPTQLLSSCLLLDLIGGSHRGPEFHFWREIKEESGSCWKCSLYYVCSTAFSNRSVTWARSAFYYNVIDCDVAPHWWTSNRFKHNLEQSHKEGKSGLKALKTHFLSQRLTVSERLWWKK